MNFSDTLPDGEDGGRCRGVQSCDFSFDFNFWIS
jgi:hypothetical protein